MTQQFHRIVTLAIVVAFCLTYFQPGVTIAAPLSPEEQQLLSELTAKDATDIVQFVNEIHELKQQLDQLKGTIRQGADDLNSSETLVDAVLKIAKVIETFAGRSPAIEKIIGYREKISPILLEAEQQINGLSFDPQAVPDLTEAEFREEAREVAYAYAAYRINEQLDGDFLKRIERLRNPSDALKKFVDGALNDWLQKPREAGDITFRILKTDQTKPLFSSQADIVIEMTYGPGIVVEARGLYFRYVDREPYFEAVLDPDKMQVTTNLKSMAAAQLQKGANELLAKLDGPVTVKNFQFTDFGTSKAGIECDVDLNFGQALPIKAGGTVKLDTKQRLEWNGALTMAYRSTPPIPIGTTPLGIHEINGGWNPKGKQTGKRQVSIGTIISTVAQETDKIIALDVKASFDFPIRAVDVDGSVELGTTSIGDIWGTLDLDKELVEVQFKIPGRKTVIPKNVLSVEGRSTLDREGLECVGKCTLFGLNVNDSRLFLSSHGHGTLTVESGKLCGVDLAPRLNAGFKPGFSEVWANLVFEAEVDLGFASLVDVAVEVNANTKNGDKPVHVLLHVWGEVIEFELVSLAALGTDVIINELRKHLPDLYEAALDSLAKGEADARKALATAEKDFKEEVSKALAKPGFDALRTGNKDLDRELGNISEAGKDAGGELAKQREEIGKTLTKIRENPGGSVGDIVNKVKDLNPANIIKNPGGLFGGGGGGKSNSGPSREELEAKIREAKAHGSLELLEKKLAGHQKRQESPLRSSDSGRHRLSETELLDIRFRNPASAIEGKQDAVLALLVSSSDFVSQLNTRGSAKQDAASDAKAATVHFRKLVADEGESHPKARVEVPPIKNVSNFDARMTAHLEIQKLVEQYVSNVEIEGPQFFYDSQLRVQNKSNEAITVWVQRHFRGTQKEGYPWKWAPGNPGTNHAYKYIIEPGKSELLTIHDSIMRSSVDTSHEKPLVASRVRLWVESESGERWLDYKEKDLWLMPPNSKLGGKRVAFADKRPTHLHTIEPQKGPRVFAERVLMLRNQSTEDLTVRLTYRSNQAGQFRWLDKVVELPSGKTLTPTNDDELKIRASRVLMTADSDNRRYRKYEETPLWLIDEVDGRRAYQADKIGTYRYTFEKAVERKGDRATVTSSSAPIKDGTKTLATAKRSDSFEILGTNGDWVKVETTAGGKKTVGWIQQKHLDVQKSSPEDAPDSSQQYLRVTASSTLVMLGEVTIARINRGNEYAVLEEKSGWYRVEVSIGGRDRHGWVRGRDVQLIQGN